MTFLLDTHALLWWLADDPALTQVARTAIRAGGTLVLVSAATAWEISIKQALGKLEAPDDLEAALAASPVSAPPDHSGSCSCGGAAAAPSRQSF